jgi:hypothetical protein
MTGKPVYSQKQQAKLLTMILEKRIGRKHTPKEFGLCMGLVEAWGTNAPDYLTIVLDRWSDFCGYAKNGGHVKYARWFETPDNGLRFLRRFVDIVPGFVVEEAWL